METAINQESIKKIQEQYDAAVKKFLSGRYVLAWILKECTTEFKDFAIEQIVKKRAQYTTMFVLINCKGA